MEIIKRIIAWINEMLISEERLTEDDQKPKHNRYVQKLLVSYYIEHNGATFKNDKFTVSRTTSSSITLTLSNGVVVHEESERLAPPLPSYAYEWVTTIHRPGNWVEHFIELFEPPYLIAKRNKQEKLGDELVAFMTVDDNELFMRDEECEANQGERSPSMEV